MKCMYCGKENEYPLCTDCWREDVFDELSKVLRYYKDEKTDNPHIKAYISLVGSGDETYEQFAGILNMTADPAASFYICKYHAYVRDDVYEDMASSYIKSNEFDKKTQSVLYDLLSYYMYSDFEKPEPWVRMVMEREDCAPELYGQVATYYSLVGEYDLAECAIAKENKLLEQDGIEGRMLTKSPEAERIDVSILSRKIKNYREKRPYWPNDLVRREKIKAVYDKKGIIHPDSELWKTSANPRPHNGVHKHHTRESDFEPIMEYDGEEVRDYCAFWCNEAYSLHSQKDIYELAAVKVRGDKIKERFQRSIKPWSGGIVAQKDAARKLGISLEEIKRLDGVISVLDDFFQFVGNDVLLSTDALGNQGKLLSRAARYADMKSISSKFLDILDYAADVNSEYDLKNNSRQYLIQHFKLKDDGNALVKAENNVKLYRALKREIGK